ncbi:MAG: phosphatase PAP2 family protein [Thermoanaerobaculia bacterium]
MRRLRPYEILVLANTLLVAALLSRRVGLPVRSILEAQPSTFFLGFGLVAAGAALRAADVAREDGAARARLYLRLLSRPENLLDLSRMLIVLGLVTWSYSWLKVFVTHLNRWVTDPLLASADFRLHLGINPNRFLIELFPYPALWQGVDYYYAGFVFTLGAGFALLASALDSRERSRFAAGFAVLWIAGSWFYVALPSLGPCYVFPEDYTAVRAHLPLQTETQRLLIAQYRIVTSGMKPGTELNPVFGIAAMPSLHVAGQAFLAFAARKRHPRLALFFAVLSILTFLGSLVTGWHYAVDGYAGFLLAWGAWRLGTRLG